MPKSLALMLCAIAFCIPNAIIHGQSATQSTAQEPTQPAAKVWMRIANNGAWWNTLSQDSKSDFIDGYVSAMADVHKMLLGFAKLNSKELHLEPPAMPQTLANLMHRCLRSFNYPLSLNATITKR
jgi:hypothetical protein